jgi:prevent-host-death family protein
MREVALYEAKNKLSALVAEVEESGEEIVITRHGKPAARLAPVGRKSTPESRAALGAMLRENIERIAREHPASLTPLSWEELKADMDEDR